MSIHVPCEGCGKVLSVPNGSEGRAIKCAHCGKRMRVPNPAPQAAAEAAPPPAAPATPPPAAPVAPSPPPAAPVTEGVPDKDAFFKALAEEAARDQRETDAVKAAKAAAEAELEPAPEEIVQGKSSATKELRIKTAADKTGYAVAEGPLPPRTASAAAPPAGYDMRPHPLRKLIAVAVGLLLLISIIIITLVAGPSSRKSSPVNEAPMTNSQAVAPQPVTPPPPPEPALPAALKEASQALAADTLVEVEVVEADADATAKPMPVLTPAGDLMLDVTSLQIRDKDNAGANLQEMRSAIRPVVYESVAAKLREKGLAPVEAGPSTATSKPEDLHNRLKVFIRTTPAWAGFNFRERWAPPPPPTDENAPGQPGQPGWPGRPGQPGQSGQPGSSPHPSQPSHSQPSSHSAHHTQYTLPAATPGAPGTVNLWARLLSGGLTLDARFNAEGRGGAAQNWFAVADDDVQADLLPCGLRISIVRVVWEVGGRTHDLTGKPAAADAALSGQGAETGIPVPFRRPKQIREIQITAQKDANQTCIISGFCQYNDVDLQCGAAAAGELVAGLLVAPEADWHTLWDGKAGRDAIAAACRNILRLGGGPAIAEALAAKPDRLPRSSVEALVSVLKEDRSSPEWARPFFTVRGPFRDAALIGLARQATEENLKDFLQWVATPAGHSPESVQAACCALIDLGRPGPEVNALIDTRAVKAFSEVRSPRGSLAFPPQTAQTVLDWLIRNGDPGQRIGAAAAAIEGNVQELQGRVLAFLSQPLGFTPETFYTLCKGLGKTPSPPDFEILSSVAKWQLAKADLGDRFLPPEALSGASAPLPEGRYSRTVAALVCADLARYDRFEAGKALVGLIQSPGPVTRYCAIETLMALDDVDVSKELRARYEILSKKPRNAYETQEWELLNPAKNKLCRYDIPMLSAENDLKTGNNMKDVIEICDNIIKENPSPTLVERAKAMMAEAEKNQLDHLDAENALKDGSRAKEVIEICDNIIKENPSPTLVERAKDMKRQAEKLLENNAHTPQ
jgi:LSD1 subclass zinc finger protein